MTQDLNDTAVAEDVGNILTLEHVNIRVPDQLLATVFYVVGLGFTRDPYSAVGVGGMHVNVGDQQFHLPTGQAQVLRGHTGLVLPDLTALKDRLGSIQAQMNGTSFGWADRGDYVDICSPWRNMYRAFAPGGYGAMQLGMPYVEFSVPVGCAQKIQRFYAEAFDAPVTLEDGHDGIAARIAVGLNQSLIFRESAGVPDYDGHHVAIYVANFSRPYRFLEQRGLVTYGIHNHEFRFRDIVDPDAGSPLFTIEHEVRSSRHPGMRRKHVNRE
jgi:hypothetical protein